MKLTELMDQVRQASGNTLDMLTLKSRLDEMGIHLENLYQELEMSSSYVDSHRDISATGEVVQPHSHSFFELILCCSCDQVQYLLGSQRYRLQKGDVMLKLDLDYLKEHAPSIVSPVLCTELDANQKIRLLKEGNISAGEALFAVDICE